MVESYPREVDVTDLLAIPGGGDEVGTPAAALEKCTDHDVLYRVGGACLVCEREGER